jgi:DNA sulfur modification protein DndD
LLRDQLITLADRADAELEADQQQDIADLLKARDRALTRRLRHQQVPDETIQAVQRYLAADRKARQDAATEPPVAKLDREHVAALRHILDSGLDLEVATVVRLLDERANVVAEHEDVTRALASVPAEAALDDLRAERDEATRAVAQANQARDNAEVAVAEATAAEDEAERRFSQLLNKAADETSVADDARRMIEHSQRVRSTLAKFRDEASRRNVDRIQTLILQSFERLARKARLITDIRIDPQTFDVELQGRDGTVLLPQQLSAGERQLLAVSMLWGLAQASGRPLPVVIDTPLGRLDGVHRNHLIERYFPQASHQVILLSTDQEIDEAAWEKLRPHVGHTYTLEHDTASGATTATTGYLW